MPSEKTKDPADLEECLPEIGEFTFSVLRHPFRSNLKELESAIGNLQAEALKHAGRPEGNVYAVLASNLISVRISKEHGKNSRSHKAFL